MTYSRQDLGKDLQLHLNRIFTEGSYNKSIHPAQAPDRARVMLISALCKHDSHCETQTQQSSESFVT